VEEVEVEVEVEVEIEAEAGSCQWVKIDVPTVKCKHDYCHWWYCYLVLIRRCRPHHGGCQ
jgi:hypothetical protein